MDQVIEVMKARATGLVQWMVYARMFRSDLNGVNGAFALRHKEMGIVYQPLGMLKMKNRLTFASYGLLYNNAGKRGP